MSLYLFLHLFYVQWLNILPHTSASLTPTYSLNWHYVSAIKRLLSLTLHNKLGPIPSSYSGNCISFLTFYFNGFPYEALKCKYYTCLIAFSKSIYCVSITNRSGPYIPTLKLLLNPQLHLNHTNSEIHSRPTVFKSEFLGRLLSQLIFLVLYSTNHIHQELHIHVISYKLPNFCTLSFLHPFSLSSSRFFLECQLPCFCLVKSLIVWNTARKINSSKKPSSIPKPANYHSIKYNTNY